jgi:hypothetical protein
VISTLVATAILGLGVPAQGKGGPKTSGCPGVNVYSIVADFDSSFQPFQFQSDGQGKYESYSNSKTDSLVSEIQANSCDWVLDLSNSQSRKVTLTLSQPASNGDAPPFTGSQAIAARIISKCSQNADNNGLSYGSMTFNGQTFDCGFSAAFDYNGSSYALRMEPNNFAGTTWARVTCTGAVSNQCNAWTVTGEPDVTNSSTGQVSAIGELVQVSTTRGKTVQTPLGLYYVAFSITIHP